MKIIIKKISFVLIIFILSQCQPLRKPELYEIKPDIKLKAPVIRVGLIDLPREVEISSEDGLRIIKKDKDSVPLKREVRVVRIEMGDSKGKEVFYVQIGAFVKRENAQNFVNQWKPYLPFQPNIYQSSQFHQIRMGPFLNKASALEVLNYSIRRGLKDAWVVSENLPPENEDDSISIDGEKIKGEEDMDLFLLPGSHSDTIKINESPYRGIIEIKKGGSGLSIINIINVDDYLKGVVPIEMNPEQFNELEALKAQAVSARTFAIKRLISPQERNYDICSTQKCQVYRGSSFEHPISNKAVEETEGEILVWKGEPIDALYTGSCGGYTEDVENVFGGDPVPYLKGTYCFHENDKVSSSEWVEEKTKKEVERILKRQFSIEDIIDIYPIRRGVSGRIVEIRILSTKSQLDLRGFIIKELFGLKDLPFEILRELDSKNEIDKFFFKGKGRGHGIGLCQEGAYLMAKSKKSYTEILLHYYRDVGIVNWKEVKR
ncbi:MAG: SpoIID/LytB domain-containing protein [Candidatus Aminicenantia bacterium]